MILNLQFWEGDKAQAMALARLIADLQAHPRNDVTFLFTARFDASHDSATIEYVKKKFNVATFKTTRMATGWPDGPNQMAGESYKFCCDSYHRGTIRDPHRFVLLMEADCVPLRASWIDELIGEFTRANKMAGGAWLEVGDAGCRHINGNMMLDLTFGGRCQMLFFPPHRGGWDAILAQHIMPYAYPSRLIWSDYRLGTSDNPWKGCDYLWAPKRYGSPRNPFHHIDLFPCWYHGVKGLDALTCVRNKLIPGTSV